MLCGHERRDGDQTLLLGRWGKEGAMYSTKEGREKLRKNDPSELHFDKFNKLLGSKSIVQERRKG